jgi:hypothetical protein
MIIELVSAHLHVSQFGQLGSRATARAPVICALAQNAIRAVAVAQSRESALHLHISSSGAGWKIANHKWPRNQGD